MASSFSFPYPSKFSFLPQSRVSTNLAFNSSPMFQSVRSKSSSSYGNIKAQASDNKHSNKVTIIGSTDGIGPALSAALWESPLVGSLAYYSIGGPSHLNACISGNHSQGKLSELERMLKDSNVVVIATPFPMANLVSGDDRFIENAKMVKACLVAVAAQCPHAFIIIYNRMVNSIVPMAAEVLKQRGVFDPNKLFGFMTPEQCRCNVLECPKQVQKLCILIKTFQ